MKKITYLITLIIIIATVLIFSRPRDVVINGDSFGNTYYDVSITAFTDIDDEIASNPNYSDYDYFRIYLNVIFRDSPYSFDDLEVTLHYNESISERTLLRDSKCSSYDVQKNRVERSFSNLMVICDGWVEKDTAKDNLIEYFDGGVTVDIDWHKRDSSYFISRDSFTYHFLRK